MSASINNLSHLQVGQAIASSTDYYGMKLTMTTTSASTSTVGPYALLRLVGSGAYGTVYEAEHRGTRARYAVKRLRRGQPARAKDDEEQGIARLSVDDVVGAYFEGRCAPADRDVYREIALHGLVHGHENVATIHEVLADDAHLYMVMDYFACGDLFHAITDLRWYIGRDHLIRRVMLQLVQVVNYCHSMGVYHCDLKPENIMIANDGHSIRIADFGLATCHLRNLNYSSGSSFYMAPERLLRLDPAGFNSKLADIWALGVILLNLTCGRNPWKKANPYVDNSFRTFLHDRLFLMKIMPVSAPLNSFLLNLFHLAPSKRYSLFDLYHFVYTAKSFSQSPTQKRPKQLLPPLDIIGNPPSPPSKRKRQSSGPTCSGLLTPPTTFDDDDCMFKKPRLHCD